MLKNQKHLLVLCFYAFFCCGVITLTIGSVLPDLRRAWNLSDTFSGILLSGYSLGSLMAGITGGFAGIYFGQKRAVLLSSIIAYIGIFILTQNISSAFLFIAFFLTGLGRGSVVSFTTRAVNLLTDGSPVIQGFLHVMFAVGAISAPIFFTVLRNAINWKAGLFLVIFMGIVMILNFLFIKIPESNENNANKSFNGFGFLRERGFIIISFLMFFYLCSEFAINGWLVTYVQHKGLPTNYSQAMAALLWAVILFGRLICALLAKYIHQSKILLVLSIGAVIFFGIMLFAKTPLSIALSVMCVGSCMSGISPIIYASSAPFTNKYSLAMGTLFTIGCTGGVLMQFIIGIISEHLGFNAGMTMILFTFIMLLIFALLNKNTGGKI